MAKKGKKNKHSRKMTLPLAVVAGLASPVARTVQHGIDYGITGPEGAVGELSRIMTGYNPFESSLQWQSWRMKYGLYPVLAGIMVHKLAGFLGVNRAIAQAGIPVLRI